MRQQTTPPPPKISIAPPQAALEMNTSSSQIIPKDEPDLINLESAKSSPVPSMKKSTNSSSSDSLDQMLNKADVHVSDTDSTDDKILTSPPIIISPPPAESTDSPSKNSLDSKADSFDSLDELKIKSNEETEPTEIGEVDQNIDIKSPAKLNETKGSREELPQVITDAKKEGTSPVKLLVTENVNKDGEQIQSDEVEAKSKREIAEETNNEEKDIICEDEELNKETDATVDSKSDNIEVETTKEEITKVDDEEVKEVGETEKANLEIEGGQLDFSKTESEETPQSPKVSYFLDVK